MNEKLLNELLSILDLSTIDELIYISDILSGEIEKKQIIKKLREV